MAENINADIIAKIDAILEALDMEALQLVLWFADELAKED